jgi:hypothetical protein
MANQKKGFVALLDVLGFSDRVLRGTFEGLDAYVKTVERLTEPHQRLRTILFSDTIVLFTLDESDHAFHEIITVSSRLLYQLLREGIPVRGAISYGEFLRSDQDGNGTVIAGRPIIDAHFYESRLQWIGIMIAPSVLEHRGETSTIATMLQLAATQLGAGDMFVDALKRLRIQPCENVPLHDASDGPFEGFAIVPISPQASTLEDLRDSIDDMRHRLARLKQLAPDARSQAKYRRTIDWLTQVRSNFARFFDDHITPPTTQKS